jgi:hypothetical protein
VATNTFEGTHFVDQKVAVTALQYSLDLFPGFGTAQADAVGSLYADLGSDLFQANAVQGECASSVTSDLPSPELIINPQAIFICPTYYLLSAFRGRAFKVGYSHFTP